MIQIDMPMPKCCDECFALDDHGDYPFCLISKDQRGYTFNVREKRMPTCPLKAQEPRVMTWHEVIGAVLECKPVFIEAKDSEDKEQGDDRWAMVTQYKDSITNGMIHAMSSYITSEILFEDWYGKTWRCWTSKPTNKQRQETKWA